MGNEVTEEAYFLVADSEEYFLEPCDDMDKLHFRNVTDHPKTLEHEINPHSKITTRDIFMNIFSNVVTARSPDEIVLKLFYGIFLTSPRCNLLDYVETTAKEGYMQRPFLKVILFSSFEMARCFGYFLKEIRSVRTPLK